jgi:hypothetical protein
VASCCKESGDRLKEMTYYAWNKNPEKNKEAYNAAKYNIVSTPLKFEPNSF